MGHLQLRNVTFAYPSRAVPVFRSFNLTVPAGSTLALVGASGSGKSTVVRVSAHPFGRPLLGIWILRPTVLAPGVHMRLSAPACRHRHGHAGTRPLSRDTPTAIVLRWQVALAQRLYDVQGGQVLLDSTDVRRLQVKWLRSHIGVVSQEPVRAG